MFQPPEFLRTHVFDFSVDDFIPPNETSETRARRIAQHLAERDEARARVRVARTAYW